MSIRSRLPARGLRSPAMAAALAALVSATVACGGLGVGPEARPLPAPHSLTLAGAAPAATPGSAAEPNPPSAAEYEGLRRRALLGDPTIDFGRLRLGFARTSRYAPYGDRRAHSGMVEALRRESYTDARQRAEKLLETNFADVQAHVVAAIACAKLQDPICADDHAGIARGLVRSIEESGQGTSASPWVVIDISEQQELLRARRLRRTRQMLVRCDGAQPCDRVEVEHVETGVTSSVFFDVSLPMADLQRRRDGGVAKRED